MVICPTEVVGHRAIGRTTEREEHAPEDHRHEARDGEIARLTRKGVPAEADDHRDQDEGDQDLADHAKDVSARWGRWLAEQAGAGSEVRREVEVTVASPPDATTR